MKKFWWGLAFGTLVAGVAVALFVPRTGKSTRRLRRGLEDLGDNLSDAADYLKVQAERLAEEAQNLADSGKQQLDEAVAHAESYVKAASPRLARSARG